MVRGEGREKKGETKLGKKGRNYIKKNEKTIK
jgi:hypothetical protein